MYHPTLTTTADALAALDHATTQVVAGEVGQVLAIAALCDVHEPDAPVLVDGSERYLQMGADGTPVVGEFIAADIAALLGVSPGVARSRIAQVLNLRHRHPVLWHTVCAGDVRFWEAARIADACVAAGLDAEGAAWVDRQCGIALALQPWARVRSQVDGWILMADPELAAQRELQAAAARYVRLGQLQKGHIPLWGQLDAADGLAFDDALNTIANTLEAGVPLEERRAIAVGILARGAFGQSELPRAEVIIRIDATPTHEGDDVRLADAATVEGWGTALTRKLSDLLPGCQVRVRPIVDARTLDPVDSYEIPERMRHALQARWPADAFPFGSRPSRACDSDHTIPYDHDAPEGEAQTHPDLMAPLSRFTHRVKTHGGWTCEQPIPGMLIWGNQHGWRWATTPTGTVLIERPEPTQYAWWKQEPPDWLDDPPPSRAEIDAETGRPADPGPAQPALALAPLPIT